MPTQNYFPDGTPMEPWFAEARIPVLKEFGRQYSLSDYGIDADGRLHTAEIQDLIDHIHADGGGVLVVPRGTYRTGALFFRPGVHLYVTEDGMLLGSDDVTDYPVLETRIEGETCQYLAALINADACDGFTMFGPGTIDGNGLRAWKAFWHRRAWNPKCTNKDEQRPRLVYISNSSHVTIAGLHLQNAAFWTNHLYRCQYVKFLECTIDSPYEPVKAPSTDAIDLDVCSDVLVKDCDIHVNDDAVVLKGGKGTFADQAPENGPCYNILVENCHYGTVHGCMTLGSESLHDWNVIMRNCHADNTNNVLWLKMRPDTPQHYEYVHVEGFTGHCRNFLLVRPWTQFYEKQEREDMPLSQCNNVSFRNIRMDCGTFFNVTGSDKYELCRFSFDDIDVVDHAKVKAFTNNPIDELTINNVIVNGEKTALP